MAVASVLPGLPVGYAIWRACRLDSDNASNEVRLNIGSKPGHSGTSALTDKQSFSSLSQEVCKGSLSALLPLKSIEWERYERSIVVVKNGVTSATSLQQEMELVMREANQN